MSRTPTCIQKKFHLGVSMDQLEIMMAPARTRGDIYQRAGRVYLHLALPPAPHARNLLRLPLFRIQFCFY